MGLTRLCHLAAIQGSHFRQEPAAAALTVRPSLDIPTVTEQSIHGTAKLGTDHDRETVVLSAVDAPPSCSLELLHTVVHR